MPSESLDQSELNGKRKIKNKVPKRLRRKNKQNDRDTEDNITNNIATTDDTSLIRKQKISQENIPYLLNTSSSTTDNNPVVLSTDETSSLHYWRLCTKKATDILEKQASNRRKILIERHEERVESIKCVLYQREQINMLMEKNHSMSQSLDTLHDELRTKEETLKTFEDKLHDRDEIFRDNEFLRVQFRLMEQKFDRFTIEYSKKLEENRQHEHEYTEQIQSLMDEIERIKRDLVLEEYRKQEAERKVRYYDDKIKLEQTVNKKLQQDLTQLKQELKSIHMRYDSLQIEMLAMHKANNDDLSLIPTKDTNENQCSKKRAINHDIDDEPLKIKRSKRKTRDRTESSASTASSCSDQHSKIATKLSKNKENDNHNPSLTVKRKTLKSNKTNKNHLPMVTVTHASPSVEQPILAEKDSAQLLLPPSVSTTSDGSTPTSDSHDTNSEIQVVQPRAKKPSRYPCRRAQRPVKQTETNDQIQQ